MPYTQSDKVTKKEKEYYDYIDQNKPGEFSSEYTGRAKAALDDYSSHGDFKYNPATDSAYQAARKQYTAGGKQAMKDTLGTATELTGGYNNSYAQAAAQQQYNSYMSQLSSLMPQYEDRAYSRWKDEGQRKYDYYAAFKAAEEADYNKHRDRVNDFNTERNFLYGAYADEKNADYSIYQDNVANDQWERTFAHQQAKDNAAAAAAQTNANANYYEAFAKYNNSLADNAPVLYDYAGAVMGEDDDGNSIRTGTRFYYDGKEKKYDLGINPYTSTVNRDVKNGAKVAGNGYQPIQIGIYDKKGKLTGWQDLSKTGETDVINGRTQNIWQTSDGTKYIWDGTQNTYLLYQED